MTTLAPVLANRQRVAKCYARRKQGRRVYELELNEDDLAEELIITGYLQVTDRDNHAAVARGLGRAVEFLIFGKKEHETAT